jgi:drug/metabolite transporter (DMT)-like permease
MEGLALALTGVAIVLIVTGGAGARHYHSLLLGVVSGIIYGTLIVLLKDLSEVPAPAIHVWTNLGTAALVLPIALLLGVHFPAVPRDLGLLALMGSVQLALPYYLFQRALRGTRALEASIVLLLEPILNPTLAYLVVGEMPSARVIAGCALIACGLVGFAVGNGARRASATPQA